MLPRFHIGSKIAFANRRYRISTSPIFPRKWTIRYSWSSVRYWWISSASSRADVQAGSRQPGDHAPEEERRDLQIEDRRLRLLDGRADVPIRLVVCEVTRHVGQALRKAAEDLVVD